MPLRNFREVRDRFTHIDAEFVSCSLGFPADGHYAVRFYAWWEHPRYLNAVETGASWAFDASSEAERVVTVYPRGLVAARVTRDEEIEEWTFIDSEHEFLWPYEDVGQLFLREPLPKGSLYALPRLVQRRLPFDSAYASVADFVEPLQWTDPTRAEQLRGGFSLGTFPRSLLSAFRSELDELGVGYLIADEPEERNLPVLLTIDGYDYLAAEDFELDVPEFAHEDRWFRP